MKPAERNSGLMRGTAPGADGEADKATMQNDRAAQSRREGVRGAAASKTPVSPGQTTNAPTGPVSRHASGTKTEGTPNMKTMIKASPASAVASVDNKAGSATKTQATVKARGTKRKVAEQMVKGIFVQMAPILREMDKARLVLHILRDGLTFDEAAKIHSIPALWLKGWTETFLKFGTESLQPVPLWLKQKRDAARLARYWRKCYDDALSRMHNPHTTLPYLEP